MSKLLSLKVKLMMVEGSTITALLYLLYYLQKNAAVVAFIAR